MYKKGRGAQRKALSTTRTSFRSKSSKYKVLKGLADAALYSQKQFGSQQSKNKSTFASSVLHEVLRGPYASCCLFLRHIHTAFSKTNKHVLSSGATSFFTDAVQVLHETCHTGTANNYLFVK
jgi:hypothetical protein